MRGSNENTNFMLEMIRNAACSSSCGVSEKALQNWKKYEGNQDWHNFPKTTSWRI